MFSKIGSRFQFFKLFLELEKNLKLKICQKAKFCSAYLICLHSRPIIISALRLPVSLFRHLSLSRSHTHTISLSLSFVVCLHLTSSVCVSKSHRLTLYFCFCVSLYLCLFDSSSLCLSYSLSLSLFLQLLLRLPDISCIRKTDCLTH